MGEVLDRFSARWPALQRAVGHDPCIVRTALNASLLSRALDYLEACAYLTERVPGFTSERLAALLRLAVRDGEAFLDKRAELEIIRRLYLAFPSGIEWVEEVGPGVKPDIRLRADGHLVSFEVTRLRSSSREEAAEEQRRRIEQVIAARGFPFKSVVFVDLSCATPESDPACVIEEAGRRALESAERLAEDEPAMSELAGLRSIDRADTDAAEAAFLDALPPDADAHSALEGLLAIWMRSPRARRKVELCLGGGATGSLSAYYFEGEPGCCSLHVFGRLPDESRTLWSKVTDECKQLPRGGTGVVVLWVDRQADLVDLYSPKGCVTENGVEWGTELEVLFGEYGDRCSAVAFMSGFESALVANPLASGLLRPELAASLALALGLPTWGYLRLSREPT